MDDRSVADFVEQRNKWRYYSDWPISIAYGLNKFEPVQALNSFTAHTVSLLLNLIPGVNTMPNSQVFDTARLTRYRNYRDNII